LDKLILSERDICTKCITPAIQLAGWQQHEFREEVQLTDGRVMVRGNLAARIKNPEVKGGPKRADYVLYARSSIPIAVVEAKQNKYSLGHGMQQALAYAELLDAPFAISSNGDGFLLHDRTGLTQPVERELSLNEFPSLETLWPLYQQWKGLTDPDVVKLIAQPYYSDGSGRGPRYYQRVAINRAIEAIAKGQQRVLLVMATGTGKTYTAFQFIWLLWKAKAKKTHALSGRPQHPGRPDHATRLCILWRGHAQNHQPGNQKELRSLSRALSGGNRQGRMEADLPPVPR